MGRPRPRKGQCVEEIVITKQRVGAMFSRYLLTALVVLTGALPSIQSAAQTYPSSSIRLVVPFAPGGPVDFVARTIHVKLGESLGQPVIIENKPGAGGNIAAASVTRANPDGYTLLLVYETHATSNLFYKGLKFDAFDSFEYLSMIGYSPIVLMTSKASGLDSIPKLVAASKAAPGKLIQAVSSPGPSGMMRSALVHQALGTQVRYVPFSGSAGGMNAILAGQVDINIASLPVALGLTGNNLFNSVAILSDAPSPLLPDVPPISKYVQGGEYKPWVGIVGPKGMPADVKAKVVSALQASLNSPEVRRQFDTFGFVVQSTGPEDFIALAKSDYEMAENLLKTGVLKME